MPQTNQHYVPRHYLRRFSYDNQKQISLIILSQSKAIHNAALKHQCSRNNFYGEDKVIEGMLSEFEGESETFLRQTIEDAKLPSSNQARSALLAFATILHGRTQKKADDLSELPKRAFKEMLRRMVDAGRIPPPPACITLDDVEFELRNAPALSVYHALLLSPLAVDLHLNLLEAPVGRFFITSDNPVVMMNQMFHGRTGDFGSCGWAMRGLQVFVPLSSRLCLVAFDRNAYRIGKPDKRRMPIDNPNDVDLLNALQIMNARDHLYFHNPSLEKDILKLIGRFGSLRSPIGPAVTRRPYENPDGTKGLMLLAKAPEIPLPGNWSFCKSRTALDLYQWGVRDRELCRLHDRWSKAILSGSPFTPFGEWLQSDSSGQ